MRYNYDKYKTINIPLVKAFGIIGGGAALAFVGATSGLLSLAPAVVGIGGLGNLDFYIVMESVSVTNHVTDL